MTCTYKHSKGIKCSALYLFKTINSVSH